MQATTAKPCERDRLYNSLLRPTSGAQASRASNPDVESRDDFAIAGPQLQGRRRQLLASAGARAVGYDLSMRWVAPPA